jgi:nitroreductase
MEFSKPITDIIKERTSWRTYNDKLLENNIREELKQILKLEGVQSPFKSHAGNCRFELISVPEFKPNERKKIGTYGLIAGAQEFIVGACEKAKYDRENFAYLFELIILAVTDLGLGTCWLGGFFNRDLFSSKINAQDEIVPAVSPVGYPKDRRFKEKLIRRAIGAKNRKSWEKIFFQNDFDTPINKEEIGEYATLLEMIRLGPSAGNKQPWRVIKEENRNLFHFYVANSEGKKGNLYRKFIRLDIGIALCHFDLTAKELKIDGNWEFQQPVLYGAENFKYIISWNGK